MIKQMNVNRQLPIDKLESLVSRVDSIRKASIAELWVLDNDTITEIDRCRLLRDVHYKYAICYGALLTKETNKEVVKLGNVHKIHIDGVRELKVG